MSRKMVRKSYFVEPSQLRELKKVLAAPSEAEALRRVVAEALENRKFWNWFVRQKKSLRRTDLAP